MRTRTVNVKKFVISTAVIASVFASVKVSAFADHPPISDDRSGPGFGAMLAGIVITYVIWRVFDKK